MILQAKDVAEFDRETLISEIEAVFKDVPQPAAYEIVEGGSLEAAQIRASFSGREWSTLSNEFLRYNHDSLVFMTPKACRYFLPAFLRVCLSPDYKSDQPLYAITLGEPKSRRSRDSLRRRIADLQVEEINIVWNFILFCCETEELRRYIVDLEATASIYNSQILRAAECCRRRQ